MPLAVLAGRYLILEKIAQGGMGAVYKARDQRLQGKTVAVKEMSESAIAPADRERVLESFRREAELLARLEHPNLVRVSDRFQEGERHYMVMEFIEGCTLEQMLEGRGEPFPEGQVLAWAKQLCDVLAFLHSQKPKIIYRDMKPSNVMVLDGSEEVRLIDFGIARFFKAGKRRDTIELGTGGYAPPEQHGKAQTDERADVFALGAMLHQLLTLHDPATVPFQFPNVRTRNPKVSSRVETAIMKAVQPKRDQRHQSIEEMRGALLGDKAARRRPASAKKGGEEPARPARPASTSPPRPGKLALTPAALDFGELSVDGTDSERCLVVTIPPGERAMLAADVPWLRVHPASVAKSGSPVTVTVHTSRLPLGRLQLQGGWLRRWAGWHTRFLVPVPEVQHGRIETVLAKGGQAQGVSVTVTAVPQPWQVYAGWGATVVALVVETLVAVWILMSLLGAVAAAGLVLTR